MTVAAAPPGLAHHLAALVNGRDLTEEEAYQAFSTILAAQTTAAQVAALLAALALKGESVGEIVGAARALRANSVPFRAGDDVIDVCGTGGDGSGSLNISTAAAFVVAGAGVRVAKHGNRAMSSRCGSADVMEALGVDIELAADLAAEVLERVGIVFLFAQRYHPALRRVADVRREIAVRTIFNLAGPLSNPSHPRSQVVGVAKSAWMPTVAAALRRLGCDRGAVVHSTDGLDEISLEPTEIFSWCGELERRYVIEPRALGIQPAPLSALRGGPAEANAAAIERLLAGARSPYRDVVVLNAALALEVSGVAASFEDGMRLAEASLDSGAARTKLRTLVEETRR